jgi:hypothetical protein
VAFVRCGRLPKKITKQKVVSLDFKIIMYKINGDFYFNFSFSERFFFLLLFNLVLFNI